MPNRSIVYLLVCLTGVLLFIFIGIVPYERTLTLLDHKISGVQSQIEEQKGLLPLYKSLSDKISNTDSAGLFFPGREKLSGGHPGKILANLGDLAKQSRLEMPAISPDPTSMAMDSKLLLFRVTVRGNFANFRQFLNSLGKLPYLDHIDEIEMEPHQNNLELKLKIWVMTVDS